MIPLIRQVVKSCTRLLPVGRWQIAAVAAANTKRPRMLKSQASLSTSVPHLPHHSVLVSLISRKNKSNGMYNKIADNRWMGMVERMFSSSTQIKNSLMKGRAVNKNEEWTKVSDNYGSYSDISHLKCGNVINVAPANFLPLLFGDKNEEYAGSLEKNSKTTVDLLWGFISIRQLKRKWHNLSWNVLGTLN